MFHTRLSCFIALSLPFPPLFYQTPLYGTPPPSTFLTSNLPFPTANIVCQIDISLPSNPLITPSPTPILLPLLCLLCVLFSDGFFWQLQDVIPLITSRPESCSSQSCSSHSWNQALFTTITDVVTPPPGSGTFFVFFLLYNTHLSYLLCPF